MNGLVKFERRWELGEHEVNGICFRVVRGAKAARIAGQEDYRLDVMTPQGWSPVKMELAFFLTDFFAENEEVLYPSFLYGGRFKGAMKFIEYVKFAANFGWRRASDLVRKDRLSASRQDSFRDQDSWAR